MKKLIIAIALTTLSFGTVAAQVDRTDLLTTTLGYDIIKQGEKLKTDPTDIKETDLMKFKYVCNNPKFKRDLNRNDDEFRTEVTDMCDTILSL